MKNKRNLNSVSNGSGGTVSPALAENFRYSYHDNYISSIPHLYFFIMVMRSLGRPTVINVTQVFVVFFFGPVSAHERLRQYACVSTTSTTNEIYTLVLTHAETE